MRWKLSSVLVIVSALAIVVFCIFSVGASSPESSSIYKTHVVKRSDWTGQTKYRMAQLLVRFRPGTQRPLMDALHAQLGAHVARTWKSVPGLQLVNLPAGTRFRDAIRTYRRNPNVLYAEPNYIVHALVVPNDPDFSQQWGLQNTGQEGGVPGADIHATQAWNLTTGSSNVVIAVIDTGIDYNHPDLAANVWSNPSTFSETIDGVSIDCSPGTHGFNAITGTCDPFDDNEHGTHVSGTIGAVGNNGIGVVGVNWTVQLMACKFLDSTGSGTVSDAITCLDFVKAMKDEGVNIVATSNSWGGVGYSQALADAIQAQQQDGILFVAAAGNDFDDNDVVPLYPADYFLPNIISVAATSRFDELAAFSDVGRHTVHLGAPGQEILSTIPNDTYTTLSGTSMATPHVTGVAALLAAQDPARDWRAIKNLILAGGDTLPALSETITGKRLDAYGALTCSNSTIEQRLQPTLDSIPANIGQPLTLAVLNINCGLPAGPVAVTVTPGGQTISLLDNGVAPDQAAGDGIYTGQWTPPGLGNYSLAFPNGDTVQVTILSNYSVGQTSFNYQTISGTNLDLGDDNVATVTSPFPVQFGGGAFTQLYVSSNGTISFTNAFDDFINAVLPVNAIENLNPQNPPPPTPLQPLVTLVAPLWQDLYPIAGTNQNVFWQVTGSAPNRQLIVEWRNVGTYDCRTDSSATVTFQVVFSEGSSNIYFNYSNVVFGGACADQDYGAAASIGIQESQNVGTQWSFDQQSVGSGMSLLWTIQPGNPPPNPVPTLTSISPSTVPEGSGNTIATLAGTGFVPDSQAFVYPNSNLVTIYVSATQLQVLFPEGYFTNPDASFQVNVTNPSPGGGTSQAVFLSVSGQGPQITSISPTSIPAGSFGFLMTINGSGFTPTTDALWNGGFAGQVTYVSPTQVILGVPGSNVVNPGTVSIQLQTTATLFSNTVTFTITSPSTPGAIIAPTPAPMPGPPGFPSTPIPKRKTVQLPARFQGWKYAQQRGSSYLSQFLRKSAHIAPPASDTLAGHLEAAVPSAHTQIQGSTNQPPLPGFNFRPTLPADFMPTAVVTGDFNGDGHLDWAIANGGSNSIWIYLGKGDGTAQLPTIIPLKGFAPVALVAADMNHDGKLDLVVAEADSGTIGVLLGNGDGTFGPELEFYVPGGPESLAVADFNGDGNADVVVGLFGTLGTGQLAFLPGDGTGKLGQPVIHYGQIDDGLFDTYEIATADLNGDGLPDIVALDYTIAPFGGLSLQQQFPNAGARVYLNQGNGIFKLSQQFFFDATVDQVASGLGMAATAVALGDVNKDGCVDAVTLDTQGDATFFPGLCNGTFDTSNTRLFGTGIIAGTAALADLNGDGNLDLVSAAFPFATDPDYASSNGNSISVQFGDGTGNFGPPTIFRGEPGMYSLAVADLNGDGYLDVVTANQGTDSASVYINDGKGGFGGPSGSYIGYLAAGQMHAVFDAPFTNFAYVDVNGDGIKDLVTMEIGPQYPLPTVLTVLLGDGEGGFGPPIRSPILDVNQIPLDFALADFRNSGHPDLVMINGGYSYAINNGDGTFQKPVNTPLTDLYPTQVVVGDFNNDGKLDMVLVNYSSNPNGSGAITSLIPFLGNGDGTFKQGTAVSFNSTNINAALIRLAVAADVNHDGNLDLLVMGNQLIAPSDQNALYEFLGNGDGTFQAPKLIFNHPGSTSYISVADLNHDGLPDIVEEEVSGTQGNNFLARTYNIFLGQQDGSFQQGSSYGPYPSEYAYALIYGAPDKPIVPLQPTLADFNGDGNLDIAAFPVTAGGSFSEFGVSGGAVQTSLQILAGNGDGTFTPSNLGFGLGTTVAPQLFADVNGDGRADLVQIDQYTSSFNVISSATAGPSFQVGFVSDPVIGANGTLRVTLAYPSVSGTIIQLSASDPNISIPPSVTIPAGASGADVSFQIGSGFSMNHVIALTAQLGAETHIAYGTQVEPSADVGFGASVFNPPPSVPILAASQSVAYNLLIYSVGGYSTQIQASCQGLPSGASCQFSTNPISLPANQVFIISVTISTQTDTPTGAYPALAVLTDGVVTQQVPIPFSIGDFTMTLSPGSQTVAATGSASYTLTVAGVDGFSAPVQISCSGLPAGADCSLNGTTVTPGAQALNFTIQTQNVAGGNYSFTVTGTSGPLSHSASAQLNVTTGTFAGSVSPTSSTIDAGSSGTFTVNVNSQGGFNGAVSLSCVSPPAGISCQFNPTAVSVSPSTNGASTLTVSVTSQPAATNPQIRSHKNSTKSIAAGERAGLLSLLSALLILMLGVCGRAGRRERPETRSARKITGALGLTLIVILLSCGGGSGGSGGGGGGGGGGGTTLSVTVQGTAGTSSVSLGTISITVP